MISSRSLSGVLPEPHDTRTGKADQVQRMFDRLAPRYDLLNDAISLGMHRRWKVLACRSLQLRPGAQVLDVCTGTGDLVGYVLPLVGETGSVDGLDFSADMLARARQRFRDTPNVRFTQGDALNLPYPDNTFDGALIGFGLRNVTDIPRALAEMHRVLKPGGRMVNLDTCPVPHWSLLRLYFSSVVPRLGRLLAGDEAAYRYLSESTHHFLTPDELKAAFEAAGCVEVESQTLLLGLASLQVGRKRVSA
jgi:demethylmenaquinone methyltransferase/2-methoxy-6-polyprenyl-1,4-benzoquinol methylase